MHEEYKRNFFTRFANYLTILMISVAKYVSSGVVSVYLHITLPHHNHHADLCVSI